MNLILGARGRLGRALLKTLDGIPVDRSVYCDWCREGAEDEIARFVEGSVPSAGIIFVAAGVIAPNAEPQLYERVNFWLPRNVVAAASRTGWRVVTFGTVMETVVGEGVHDPYVASKIRLGRFVSGLGPQIDRIIHIRLHTLYGGGPPNAFMFLGQMLNAIRYRHPFKMSPGTQLREYHHVDDDALAIGRLVSDGLTGPVDLSHGEPVMLRTLASRVFEQFGCAQLLEIGAVPAPEHDNYSRTFERVPSLRKMRFRHTLPGVVEYLRACLSMATTAK